MLKLIKNIHVYSPEDMGVKDVLIAANKICRISDEIKIESNIEKISSFQHLEYI